MGDGTEGNGGGDAGEVGAGREALPKLARIGCIVLAVLGALSVLLIGSSVLSPDSVRCALSRALIDDATTDDEDYNDVDTDGQDPGEIACDEAIALAGTIPESEDGDDTLRVPDASTIRIRGGLATLVGAGQAVTGYMTLRTRLRPVRNAALGFTVVGAFFPVLGLLTVAPLVFVAYAIGFSAAAQEVWPRRGRTS